MITLIIYLENFEDCETILKNLFFSGNTALNEGGAISWIGRSPSFDMHELYFKNNSAPYGSEISSYAIRLGVDIYDKNSIQLIYSSKPSLIEGNLVNVSSGNLLPCKIIVQLLDVYGKILKKERG